MNNIGPVFRETTTLVDRGTRVLNRPSVRELVNAVSELGGLGEEVNGLLDILVECFQTIARGLWALVEPVRQARLATALVEVTGPLVGGLSAALGAFAEQLGGLIPALRPPPGISKAFADVQGELDRAARWVADELPKPEDIARLAAAVGRDLITALNGLRPGRPIQLILSVA